MDIFGWSTTDDFVQRAQASNATRDDAWVLYSTRAGHVERAEFDLTWDYWAAEFLAACDEAS